MLPGEQKSSLKSAKRERRLSSIEFCCHEQLDHSLLLVNALLEINDIAPYGDRNGLVHAVTPRHRVSDLGS